MAEEMDFDFLGWLETLTAIPVSCMNHSSRMRLIEVLTPKVSSSSITTSSGISPDWRGLAEQIGFPYEKILFFDSIPEPVKSVFDTWATRGVRGGATLRQLMYYLHEMERYDLLEDTRFRACISRDVSKYLERVAEEQEVEQEDAGMLPLQVAQVASSTSCRPVQPKIPRPIPNFPTNLEEEIEVDECANPTMENIIYDAFVSYTLEDWWFVEQMLANMEEKPYNLRLCIDLRDMLAGGNHNTVTAEVLQNRCKRVLLIISPNYLKSASCEFQYKFTQALSPGSRSKKMIPIIIETVKKLPSILRPVSMLHFTTCGDPKWFWARLAKSINVPVEMDSSNIADLKQITMNVSDSPNSSCLLNRVHHKAMQQEASSSSSQSGPSLEPSLLAPGKPMISESSSSHCASSSSWDPSTTSSSESFPSPMVSCTDQSPSQTDQSVCLSSDTNESNLSGMCSGTATSNATAVCSGMVTNSGLTPSSSVDSLNAAGGTKKSRGRGMKLLSMIGLKSSN